MRTRAITLFLLLSVANPGFAKRALSVEETSDLVRFVDATRLFGNLNGAPNGQERPFCSCTVLIEDINRDGWRDLFVGNHLLPDLLYLNEAGTFRDVAPRAGLADIAGPRAAEGAVFGDVDNDGDLDLYVLSGNMPHDENGDHRAASDFVTDSLFLQEPLAGGLPLFRSAAAESGIAINTIPCGIAFIDLNNDGWLDIYRQGHHGQTVYINQGNAVFSDDTEGWGLSEEFDSDAMGIAPADFDNDGDVDIYIGAGPEKPGQSGANVLLRNDGGLLTNVASMMGVADPDSTFSAAWGDYDNDGDLDLYLAKNGSYGTSTRNALYRNDGDGFVNVTDQAGVGDDRISAGAVFADFNNDGWLDLYVLNGGEPAWRRDTLFLNNGDGAFRDVTTLVGLGEENRRGYSLTVGDLNLDGFLDVYTGNMAGDLNQLWLNGGNANHWIEFRLAGAGPPGGANLSAIGARVRIFAGDRWLMREIVPASPSNHSELTVHFGIGDAKVVETVEVRWPGGRVDVYHDFLADGYFTLTERTTAPTPTDELPTPPPLSPTPTIEVASTADDVAPPLSRLPCLAGFLPLFALPLTARRSARLAGVSPRRRKVKTP